MILGILLLVCGVLLWLIWSGSMWVLWLSIGLLAVGAQIVSDVADYRARFAVGRLFPSKELMQEFIRSSEAHLRQNLGRLPIVVIGVCLIAALARGAPGIGAPVQIVFSLFMWSGVVVGWVTTIRLRVILRRKRKMDLGLR